MSISGRWGGVEGNKPGGRKRDWKSIAIQAAITASITSIGLLVILTISPEQTTIQVRFNVDAADRPALDENPETTNFKVVGYNRIAGISIDREWADFAKDACVREQYRWLFEDKETCYPLERLPS